MLGDLQKVFTYQIRAKSSSKWPVLDDTMRIILNAYLEIIELPRYNEFAQINWRCTALQGLHANAVHLYVIGRPPTDIERQKLGIFRENSPKWVKIRDFKETEKNRNSRNFRAVRMPV